MFCANTRVLILDDMMTMRKVVAKNLRDVGLSDIQEAKNGKEGWDILQASNPPIQLIISDWNMPECTGVELLKKIRSDARYSKLPFLLLTAEAEPHQVAEAMSHGVTGYIVKPFTGETLKQRLVQAHKKIAG
ncbi:MAG: response regulator [Bdellovibrionales bacterium]|jgi:two-component system chemotaxis response regulator CheY|nr:response regulator [Bdellovibrionales bacterium]